MANRRTPSIGANGVFTVSSPYSLVADVWYRCDAIRSWRDLSAESVDVFATYYEPVGLLSSDAEEDKAVDAHIVTLIGMDGSIRHVPDTYIASFPSNDTISYSRIIFSVDMGPLPDYLMYDDVLEEIRDICSQRIGKVGEVLVNRGPITGLPPTFSQHNVLETQRAAAITKMDSIPAKCRILEARINQVESERDALLQYVLDNGGFS